MKISVHTRPAFEAGYSDGKFDGIDTSSELPCKCTYCINAYYEGVDKAFEECLSMQEENDPSHAGEDDARYMAIHPLGGNE